MTTMKPSEMKRTDVYINTHLGEGPEADDIKSWVRIEAANRGHGSMSEFMRALIQAERDRASVPA